MAQSASIERALLLGIELFWERPTLEPCLRWERWRKILKLAIFAKEGISVDTLREAPPSKVYFPLEPISEEDVDNSTMQREGDHKLCNAQLKNAGPNKCQKIEAAGISCADRPWKF